MKRPRISLAYALELTAAIALGLTAFRLLKDENLPEFVKENLDSRLRFDILVPMFGFLGTVGLIEGGVVLIGRVRNRGPQVWGIGRWTWVVMSLFPIIYFVLGIPDEFLGEGARFLGPASLSEHLVSLMKQVLPVGAYGVTGAYLLASYAATSLGRRRTKDCPDEREWSGRFYGAAVLVFAAIDALLPLVNLWN